MIATNANEVLEDIKKSRKHTIVTPDERVSVSICHRAIDVLLCLFQRNIHVTV